MAAADSGYSWWQVYWMRAELGNYLKMFEDVCMCAAFNGPILKSLNPEAKTKFDISEAGYLNICDSKEPDSSVHFTHSCSHPELYLPWAGIFLFISSTIQTLTVASALQTLILSLWEIFSEISGAVVILQVGNLRCAEMRLKRWLWCPVGSEPPLTAPLLP